MEYFISALVTAFFLIIYVVAEETFTSRLAAYICYYNAE